MKRNIISFISRWLKTKHGITLFVWFGITLCLAFSTDSPRIDNNLDIKMKLPDKLGSWKGQKILYCQNMECSLSILTSGTNAIRSCIRCGTALGVKSPVEKKVLPSDIEIERKYYSSNDTDGFLVTLVAGGAARESIHRPQRCLTAQGFTILESRIVELEIQGKDKPLKAMLLETLNDEPDNSYSEKRGYFLYWFVGQGRETPYNMERMFWIATDRLLKHRVSRWAYVSVTGKGSVMTQTSDSNQFAKAIEELYSKVKK